MEKEIKKGDKFGEWTVLEPNSSPGKSWCRCSCGKEKEVKNWYLKNGGSKSCGHTRVNRSNKTKYAKTDSRVLGKTFGELTPLKRVNTSGRARYLCKCSCGREVVVYAVNLEHGRQKSCGDRIHMTDEHKENFVKAGEENIKDKQVEDTNLYNLTSKPTKRSTTGVRGVTLDKKTGHYRASINFQKKFIHLGTFKTLDEAKKARKEAEDKYFKPMLDKYKDKFKDGKNDKK